MEEMNLHIMLNHAKIGFLKILLNIHHIKHKLFINLIFVLIFYYYNFLSYINEIQVHDYIYANIKKLDKIEFTKCKNFKQKYFSCVSVADTLSYNSYIITTVNITSTINYGMKVIRNGEKLKIVKPKEVLIYENFKIIFLKRVILNQYGSIITYNNQYISLQGGCRCVKELENITNNHLVHKSYEIVFQITQYLGSAIYHSIINCLTKIIPIINTIKRYTYSKIHIHYNKALINYLSILNINKDRLVYGDIKAEYVVYMDRVECTSSLYTNSVIELRELLIKHINKRNTIYNRNIILFIKRLYTRKIKNFDSVVSKICSSYLNHTCDIYHPNTDFHKMIYLFSNADIIFGPHGAGFTNIILSKKEVRIFEIIKQNHPVLCFATLSNILKYTYYGVYSKCDNEEAFNLNTTLIQLYFNELLNLNI